MAMITIRRDEEGWTKVENVGALPRRADAASAPAPTPTPQPAVQPTRAAVDGGGSAPRSLRDQVLQPGVGDDALPF